MTNQIEPPAAAQGPDEVRRRRAYQARFGLKIGSTLGPFS